MPLLRRLLSGDLRLRPFNRQPNAKLGVSRLRCQIHYTMMFAHDAHGRVQTQSGALPYLFGGEKWLEDARANFLRNSRTVVSNLDDGAIEFAERPACPAQLNVATCGPTAAATGFFAVGAWRDGAKA